MKKIITITGAGGTVGMRLVKFLLDNNYADEIRAIDRSETAISQLIDLGRYEKKLQVYLLDLLNYSGLEEALKDSECVIHCAAMKHVSVGTVFPEELAFQNVSCFFNLVKASKKIKVRKVILCSTDKSSKPTSVMGASKLLLERVVNFSSNENTKFSTVRFGNILNSSGSIIPKIVSKLRNMEIIDINHKDMTRYMLKEEEFLSLLMFAIDNMSGGEIFIPNVRSMKICDLVDVLVDVYCENNMIDKRKIKLRILDNPYRENIDERMVNSEEIKFIRMDNNVFILSSVENNNTERRRNFLGLLSSSRNIINKKELKKLICELNVI